MIFQLSTLSVLLKSTLMVCKADPICSPLVIIHLHSRWTPIDWLRVL